MADRKFNPPFEVDIAEHSCCYTATIRDAKGKVVVECDKDVAEELVRVLNFPNEFTFDL